MPVTLKFMTITQQNFEITVESTDTIFNVKEKVHQFKGDGYEAETLKLIYLGKILDDKKTVSEYNSLNLENGRIVAMGRNVKTELAKKKKENVLLQREKAVKPTPKPTEVPEISPIKLPSNPPENFNEMLDSLVSMGIPKTDARHALTICNYDPNLAAELIFKFPFEDRLLQPIQANRQEVSSSPSPFHATMGPQRNRISTMKFDGPPTTLESFSKHPQFERMCKALFQNPTLAIPMLEEIRKQSPAITDLILSNPNEFYEYVTNYGNRPILVAPESADYTDIDETELESFIKSLSINDKLAIDRICSMGFPSDIVIPAFCACDRNENLTVEFLINNSEFYKPKDTDDS